MRNLEFRFIFLGTSRHYGRVLYFALTSTGRGRQVDTYRKTKEA